MDQNDLNYIVECAKLDQIEAMEFWIVAKMRDIQKQGYERGQADLAAQAKAAVIDAPEGEERKVYQNLLWAYTREA